MKAHTPLSGSRWSRRDFLRRGVGGAGWVALGGVAMLVGEEAGGADRGGRAFDYDLRRLRRIDPSLVQYERVGRFVCPQPEARRIALGPDDRVYLAAGRSITVTGAQGERLAEIPLSAPPRCLTVAKDGTLFVGLRDHVEVLGQGGGVATRWESVRGRSFLTGLAVAGNDVFVADAGNRVVLRYDRSGKLRRRIGERDRARGIPGFVVPSPFLDVEIGRDGLLRVNNPGRHQVEVYTFDGDLEFAWGKASAGIGDFCGCCNPVNLAMLPDDRCVTCEKGLPRVKVYGPAGVFESVVAGPDDFAAGLRPGRGEDNSPVGLDAAVDSRGRVYILDLGSGGVQILARKRGGRLSAPGAPQGRA